MDRYQIAVGSAPRPVTAYRFEQTHSVQALCRHMKRCIKEEVVFDARNQPLGILDAAVIELSMEIGVPIVENENPQSLSVAHSYQVFRAENVPEKATCAIYYGSPSSLPVPEVLIILKPESDFS